MKKWIAALFVLILMFSYGVPTAKMQAAASIIEDPALEQAIREELAIGDRTLTVQDLEELTSLYPKDPDLKIKSLKGLENAVNLEELFLPGHEITDLTPISELTNLNFLAIEGNRVENICPVSGLFRLTKLLVGNNQIKDIDCLSRMINLTDLLAGNNKIDDITALATLPLTWIGMENNQVSDLTPLEGNSTLETLYLTGNRVEDISALTSIPGLDAVDLEGNPLGADADKVLGELEARGVGVNLPHDATYRKRMSVIIDGKKVSFTQPPVNDNGTTLVQFRPLFEQLGLKVGWNAETTTVTGEKEGLNIELPIGAGYARVNGVDKALEKAPVIMNGYTYVPARFVAETLGYTVDYDEEENRVIILTEPLRMTSFDGRVQFEPVDDWSFAPSASLIEPTVYKGSARLTLRTGMKGEKAADLKGFVNNTLDRLKGKGAVPAGEPAAIKVNGREGWSLHYTIAQDGMDFTVTHTILDGDEYYYHLFLMTKTAEHDSYVASYNKVLATFKQVESREDKLVRKFGGMNADDRIADAVKYYRELGFFLSDSADLAGLQKNVRSWFEEHYEWDEKDEWFPFNPDSPNNEFADLYVLEYDKDRVWLEDTEMDVFAGNEAYVDTLNRWAAISRGAFQPTEIEEEWRSDEGPVIVRFKLNGQTVTVYPRAMSDFLDYGILGKINRAIRDTGYEFAVVEIDQTVMVTVLTAEEKAKLEQERLLRFVEWE